MVRRATGKCATGGTVFKNLNRRSAMLFLAGSREARDRRSKSLITLAAIAASVVGSRVRAADNWTGGGTFGSWSISSNWSALPGVSSATQQLNFTGTSNVNTYNDRVTEAGSITFSGVAGYFTLNGGSILLAGGGTLINNSSAATQTINLNIDLNGAVGQLNTGTASNSVGSGGLTLGDLVLNGTLSDGGVTYSTVASSNYYGAGAAFYVNGSNTYTGVTSIGSGSVAYALPDVVVSSIGNGGSAGNLGAASNAATNLVFNNGILRYVGPAATTDRSFTLATGSYGYIDVPSTTLTFTGTATGSGNLLKLGAGTLVFAGQNTNSGYNIVSAGTMVLDPTIAGNNTNIMGTGTLEFGAATPGGSGNTAATAAVGTLQINAASANYTQLIGALNSGGGSSMGHLVLNDTGAGTISVSIGTLSSNFAGASGHGSYLDIFEGPNDSVTFTNSANNSGGVLNGANTGVGITLNESAWAGLTTTGNTSTFTGAVVAIAGLDDTANPGTLGFASTYTSNNVNITATGEATTASTNYSNTARFGENSTGAITSGDIAFSLGANTFFRGFLVPVGYKGNVTVNGNGAIYNPSNTAFPIFDYDTTGTMTINASFGANINSVHKLGGGEVVLTNVNNQISGNTYVDEGTLEISSNAVLGQVNTTISGSSPQNGSLYVSGALEAYTGAGGGSFGLDGVGVGSYAVPNIGARYLTVGNGGGTINVDSGTTFVASGGVGEPANTAFPVEGPMYKNGGGTLVLPNVNNSTGGLVINGGTVIASGSRGAETGVGFTKLALQVSATETGSTTVTLANANTLGFANGQYVTGSGIPAGTTISGTPTSTGFTLSNSATLSTAQTLSVYQNYSLTGTTFSKGVNTITVPALSGGALAVGQMVSGTGIASGAVITAISGTSVTINLPTTAAAGTGTLSAYAFGGLNQVTTNAAGGSITLGDFFTGSNGLGVGGVVDGIQSGIITTTGTNGVNGTSNGFTTAATISMLAYDSLGTGSVTVNAGTLDLGGITHLGNLRTITLAGGTIQNGSLTGSSYVMQNGLVSANLLGSGVVLTKTTTGLVTLSGSNAYTGATAINAGTLSLTGSLAAASSVSVASGATFTGTGTAPCSVTVAAGGIVTPGSSTAAGGSLKTGALTLDNTTGSAMNFSIDTDATLSFSSLFSSGAVSLGTLSTLNVTDLGSSSLAQPTVLQLIAGTSVSGTFAGLPEGATVPTGNSANQYTIDYQTGGVFLDGAAAAPEPGSLGVLAVGAIGLMRRRRQLSSSTR